MPERVFLLLLEGRPGRAGVDRGMNSVKMIEEQRRRRWPIPMNYSVVWRDIKKKSSLMETKRFSIWLLRTRLFRLC